MSAREEILAQLRSRLGRNPDNAAQGRAALASRLSQPASGSRPARPADVLTQFCRKAEALASSVALVDTWQEVAAAVAVYLQAQQLSTQLVCWPELAALDWAEQGLSVSLRPAQADDVVGVTGCFAALAETGTLLLCSSAATPAVTSLLPETHIAVLPASRIVADMEAAWRLLRAEPGELPRAVNFVSGPSRTGDIEQTIVLGAHGPYRVHVIVVRGA